MTQNSWMTWVLLVGLLWIFHIANGNNGDDGIRKCLTEEKKKKLLLVADNFNGFIKEATGDCDACIVFLQKNASLSDDLNKYWPKMATEGDSHLLYLSKWHIDKMKRDVYVLSGSRCNGTDWKGPTCDFSVSSKSNCCQVRCLSPNICDKSDYNENICSSGSQISDKYIINITATNKGCINCNNPVKKPETIIKLNTTVEIKDGSIDAGQAVEVMNVMNDLASSMNGSSAELSVGEGVKGILVRETVPEDVNEISFAYQSPNDSLNIVEDRESLSRYSRSVTVSKEAFEKAVRLNVSVPFAAVLRFMNLAKDEYNSTVLGNEVLAIEMGTTIRNLTDTININFWSMNYKGIPTCHSWNSEGSRPNWTKAGCQTLIKGNNITCRCSHLTFFAILLAPLNETIPSSDLSHLTIITQVGCGLSMFFLSIVLFMHFLLRRTKASKATRILIHLVLAMFLLNFTFLINNYVAKLKNSVGCKIMAALMHYFMLATFTWFAAQAFHLCLQLYTGGKIVIHHYILKVCVTSWVIPSVIGIVLLSVGKYGEQVIYTDVASENVSMCWITDNDTHYVVNIGYYALVFLFTFTSFIVVLSWLFCLRRTKASTPQVNKNSKSIVTILGLCCMLGITWGFAFFAYGVLMIPSFYIFTVLNSFQGFFLFIYYYTSSHSSETHTGTSGNQNTGSTSSTSTLTTGLDIFENPYFNLPSK